MIEPQSNVSYFDDQGPLLRIPGESETGSPKVNNKRETAGPAPGQGT